MKDITVHYNKIKGAREKFVLFLLELGTKLHTKLYFRRKSWEISTKKLATYSPQTLGGQLYSFYRREHFEPIPKAELHDVFHVLLGFETEVRDECCMQFLLFGNGKYSPFTIGCCLISFIAFPEHFSYFKRGFKTGRAMKSFVKHNFFNELNCDVHVLKQKFRINESVDFYKPLPSN